MRARRSDRRQLAVQPLLEASRGFGAQLERCAGAADARPVEVRRLEQDRRRRGSVTSVSPPPMTPATATGLARVGDDQHVVGQLAVDVVEQCEASRPPSRGGRRCCLPPSLLVVEGVQRLAHLQHHVVRYVDDVVDRAHAGRDAGAPASTPATARPSRARRRRRGSAGRGRGPRSSRRSLSSVGGLALSGVDALGGSRHFCAGDCAATSQATPSTDSQSGRFGVTSMSKIVSPRYSRSGCADRRVFRQHEDALVRLGEAELLLGADHARRLDAADLRRLERTASRRCGRRAAWRRSLREGDLLARGDVGRAADDRCGARRRADVDRDETQAVGVRGAARPSATWPTLMPSQSSPCDDRRRP